MTAPIEDPIITPPILAEQMGGVEAGWNRQKAWRLMRQIAASFPGVVERTPGGQLRARASKLAPHVVGLRESPIEREVRLLRSRVRELEDRMDAEAAARIAFQSLAHQWFARHGGALSTRPKA